MFNYDIIILVTGMLFDTFLLRVCFQVQIRAKRSLTSRALYYMKLKAKNEHQGFSVILCELGIPTETDSKISSA